MVEEEIKLAKAKSVFYNPNMTFCRSMSSLAVGAIEEKIEVVDAFCASGIRGIRYAKENKNVKKVTFIDIDSKAITLTKKNAKTNKISKTKSDAKKGSVSRLAFECIGDFIEIDPFGTPAPYLVDAFRYFNRKKVAYLSVTATDVAVLCGGIVAACLKNYHSKPMNNEFTHENGLRIMLKRIAEVAAEFNMGIEPMISFSDRHYLKSVIKVTRSADLAYESAKQLGYVSFCQKCGYRSSSQFPEQNCNCGSGVPLDYAGALWLGQLHNSKFVKKMISLNKKRTYSQRAEISKTLQLLEGEIGMPPYYYNVHNLSKINQLGSVPKIESVILKLKDAGFTAVRTHFSDISIKTNAPHDKLTAIMLKSVD